MRSKWTRSSIPSLLNSVLTLEYRRTHSLSRTNAAMCFINDKCCAVTDEVLVMAILDRQGSVLIRSVVLMMLPLAALEIALIRQKPGQTFWEVSMHFLVRDQIGRVEWKEGIGTRGTEVCTGRSPEYFNQCYSRTTSQCPRNPDRTTRSRLAQAVPGFAEFPSQ